MTEGGYAQVSAGEEEVIKEITARASSCGYPEIWRPTRGSPPTVQEADSPSGQGIEGGERVADILISLKKEEIRLGGEYI